MKKTPVWTELDITSDEAVKAAAVGVLRAAIDGDLAAVTLPDVGPMPWNRAAAPLGSFADWAADQEWLLGAVAARLRRLVDRGWVPIDQDRALPYVQLNRLWYRQDVPSRRSRDPGPVFLASRPPLADAIPATEYLDPDTGYTPLSCRRAAGFSTGYSGSAPRHQLRHRALTHLTEQGVPTGPYLSRSRQRYARPSQMAVARLTAEREPNRRRR